MQTDEDKIRRLANRARRYVRQNRVLILETHSRLLSHPPLTVEEVELIAEKARCDWLFNESTGEARFFPFM